MKAAVDLLQQQGWAVDLLPVFNVRHDQVPVYLNACDALVLTSLQEASPMVVKEALACNLPVVATDVGDVAERINSVQNCALSTHQPQDIAANLAEVLKVGGCTNGREAIQTLSLTNVAERIIAVYRQVLESRI